MNGEKAALGQRRIESRAGMSLAQNEAVPIRGAWIARVHAQRLEVKDGQNIRDRKGATDVRRLRGSMHGDDVAPYPPCNAGQAFGCCNR